MFIESDSLSIVKGSLKFISLNTKGKKFILDHLGNLFVCLLAAMGKHLKFLSTLR